MLLRNVVKPEDVHDPISVGRSSLLRAPLRDLNSRPLLVGDSHKDADRKIDKDPRSPRRRSS
jgi:hypothetical protein